ncbi:MAG: hypothetical protein WA842_01115 [Croceibacterium sp.]
MRKSIIAAAVAVAATSVHAQTPTWQYYEDGSAPLQAFVIAKDGAQLILKCDKPGKGKVLAVFVAKAPIAAPLANGRFESREVLVQVDDGGPYDDNLRFNDRFAMAVNQHSERSLTRLLEKIADGQKLDITLRPFKQAPVQMSFAIGGARAAIAKVYEACKDNTSPLAPTAG